MSSKLEKATECLKKGLAALEDGRRLDAEEVLIEGHDLVNGTIDIKDAGQVDLLNELKGTLMSCYERMGKFEEARQLSLQRLKIFEDIYGEESSKWSAELKTLSHLEFEILDKAEEAGQVLKACQQCMITTSMAAKALTKSASSSDLDSDILDGRNISKTLARHSSGESYVEIEPAKKPISVPEVTISIGFHSQLKSALGMMDEKGKKAKNLTHTTDGKPAPEMPLKLVKEQAKVIYAWEAQDEDELSIKEGDIVNIISKNTEDRGWWRGELNGKLGVFPSNYVKLIKSTPTAQEKPEVVKPERPGDKASHPVGSSPKPVSVSGLPKDKSLPAKKETDVFSLISKLPGLKPKADKPGDGLENGNSEKLKERNLRAAYTEFPRVTTAEPETPPPRDSRTRPSVPGKNDVHRLSKDCSETHVSLSNQLTEPVSVNSVPVSQQNSRTKLSPTHCVISGQTKGSAGDSTIGHLPELRNELQALKENSKKEHDELLKQIIELKKIVEEQKNSYRAAIKDLINDAAEERKKLATLHIEVERLRKVTTV
ncbi:SH3 domain-containing kinase-binding protein 1 [Halotydeus destructor]|nr:SH3 domain-containing kinase-binding protein 1 [Halotydeus destructor]